MIDNDHIVKMLSSAPFKLMQRDYKNTVRPKSGNPEFMKVSIGKDTEQGSGLIAYRIMESLETGQRICYAKSSLTDYLIECAKATATNAIGRMAISTACRLYRKKIAGFEEDAYENLESDVSIYIDPNFEGQCIAVSLRTEEDGTEKIEEIDVAEFIDKYIEQDARDEINEALGEFTQ